MGLDTSNLIGSLWEEYAADAIKDSESLRFDMDRAFEEIKIAELESLPLEKIAEMRAEIARIKGFHDLIVAERKDLESRIEKGLVNSEKPSRAKE
ncbi:MAG: hypothetical protein AAGA96_19370 [Verrucomicrobiota bacterium]